MSRTFRAAHAIAASGLALALTDFHLIGRSQPGADDRRLHRDQERRAQAEEGHLPLHLRPAWNKAQPPFSRGLSSAERAVFTGALWRAEKRIDQIFRRRTVRPRSAAARCHRFRLPVSSR
jgi:hypothetical protein